MKLMVYCHNQILRIFENCGGIDKCVNKIVDDAMSGKFDYENCPKCPPKTGGKYVFVNVYNEEYLQLLNLHGTKSTKVSLRRMIYYYIDMEMYEEWEFCSKSKHDVDLKRRFGNALDSVRRLKDVLEYGNDFDRVDSMLKELYIMSRRIV